MTSPLKHSVFAAVGRRAACYLMCLCSSVIAPAQKVPADPTARIVDSGHARLDLSSVSRKTIQRTLRNGGESGVGLIIGSDDVLVIDVWKEPEISRTIPVRPDGKVSLPLIGELQASGLTPGQLQQEISNKLQTFISEPEVTVIVQEVKSQHFNILGQVVRPGSYQLTTSMTILDAIALAGGLRDFAKRKSIYVLRPNQDGSQVRIPFNYKNAIKGIDPVQNAKVASLDTIIVP